MTASINLTTATEYNTTSLGIKQGVSKVRFLAVGGDATLFIAHSVSQGYSVNGTTLENGKPLICEMDSYDAFKVVFASGTVTAKALG
jgi:hypothetical protein